MDVPTMCARVVLVRLSMRECPSDVLQCAVRHYETFNHHVWGYMPLATLQRAIGDPRHEKRAGDNHPARHVRGAPLPFRSEQCARNGAWTRSTR